jgi:hypothetical protein
VKWYTTRKRGESANVGGMTAARPSNGSEQVRAPTSTSPTRKNRERESEGETNARLLDVGPGVLVNSAPARAQIARVRGAARKGEEDEEKLGSLGCLPREILYLCLSFLESVPLGRIASACSTMRRVAYSDVVWKPATAKVFGGELAEKMKPTCESEFGWRRSFIECHRLRQEEKLGSLGCLPREVLELCLSFLKIVPLVRIASTCPIMRRIAYSDVVWKPATAKVFGGELAEKMKPTCKSEFGMWRRSFIRCYRECKEPRWRVRDLLARLGRPEKASQVMLVLQHVRIHAPRLRALLARNPDDPAYVVFDQVLMMAVYGLFRALQINTYFLAIIEAFKQMPFARSATYRKLPGGVDIIEFYNQAFSPELSQFLADMVMCKPLTCAEAVENAARHVPPEATAAPTPPQVAAANAEHVAFAGVLSVYLRRSARGRVTDQMVNIATAVINKMNTLDPKHPAHIGAALAAAAADAAGAAE